MNDTTPRVVSDSPHISAPTPADVGETACRAQQRERRDAPLAVSRPGRPPLVTGTPVDQPHVWLIVDTTHITVLADGHPYRAVLSYPDDQADITGPDFHRRLRLAVDAALAMVHQAEALVVR